MEQSALCGASVLSASRLEPLEPFPLPSPRRFSRSIQKPGRESRRVHAGCHLGSLRHPPSLSRRTGHPSVLTSTKQISTPLQRFAYARLSRRCLTGSCPDFSATFTTMAFDHSSLQWLIVELEGPSFISRIVAHRSVDRRCS